MRFPNLISLHSAPTLDLSPFSNTQWDQCFVCTALFVRFTGTIVWTGARLCRRFIFYECIIAHTKIQRIGPILPGLPNPEQFRLRYAQTQVKVRVLLLVHIKGWGWNETETASLRNSQDSQLCFVSNESARIQSTGKERRRPLQCRNSAFPPESTQVWLDDRFKIRWSLGSDGRGLVQTDRIPFPSQHMGYFTARHEEDLCKSHRWICYTARQDKWLSEFMEHKPWQNNAIMRRSLRDLHAR